VKKPAAPAAVTKTLRIGDAAPAFKVTQWYKGGPVALEPEKAYLVECWATWCGPCVAAFPHLSELAKANKGKLTVIGVNVWERKQPEAVKTFVEAQGDKMSYNVAADGEGAIGQNWLKAAGRNGIPCAFLVLKGKIVWIGHPGTLTQALLGSILDGTCDLAALARATEQEEAASRFFQHNVVPLIGKHDYAGAIVQLEAMKKQFPSEEKRINSYIADMKSKQAKAAS
jgi:thiol-disulfide isomerase/thioredoxin